MDAYHDKHQNEKKALGYMNAPISALVVALSAKQSSAVVAKLVVANASEIVDAAERNNDEDSQVPQGPRPWSAMLCQALAGEAKDEENRPVVSNLHLKLLVATTNTEISRLAVEEGERKTKLSNSLFIKTAPKEGKIGQVARLVRLDDLNEDF
ncbi:hypothetical protein N9L68_05000 [bacterium]|nr:hypothetical protein [bacterium]